MVSVIIPTFNRAGFLPTAVRSVLSQSYADLELMVVDDGSTDDTERAIRGISDSRLEYFRIDHGGVSRARNFGIGRSRGEWISFLDSDDAWNPGKLSRQIEALESDSEYRIGYTNELWIRNGRRVNQKKKHRKYAGWIYHRCLPLCIISPSSVMIHRSLLEKTGSFDEELPVCEDYELWLRICSRFPVQFIDEPLITKVGGHADQLSRTGWGFDIFRVRALEKNARSSWLSYQQKVWTAHEIVRKCRILLAGFRKRGKEEEAAEYRERIRYWEDYARRTRRGREFRDCLPGSYSVLPDGSPAK